MDDAMMNEEGISIPIHIPKLQLSKLRIMIFIDVLLCIKWKVFCFVYKQYCFIYPDFSYVSTPWSQCVHITDFLL